MVLRFDLALLVIGEIVLMLGLLKEAECKAAPHKVYHAGNPALVGRHEHQVVLELADLAIGALVFEDLGDIGRRLAQIGRNDGGLVAHHHEQGAFVADFVGDFVRTGGKRHGVKLATRQSEKRVDVRVQFHADFGRVEIPHHAADDHGEVGLYHEAQRGARAIVQIDGIRNELHAGLLDE